MAFRFVLANAMAEARLEAQSNIGVVTICRADKLDDVNGREEDCFRFANGCPGGQRTGADAGAA
jgi:hypothetical protein